MSGIHPAVLAVWGTILALNIVYSISQVRRLWREHRAEVAERAHGGRHDA